MLDMACGNASCRAGESAITKPVGMYPWFTLARAMRIAAIHPELQSAASADA
jgi:hypothetical protein